MFQTCGNLAGKTSGISLGSPLGMFPVVLEIVRKVTFFPSGKVSLNAPQEAEPPGCTVFQYISSSEVKRDLHKSPTVVKVRGGPTRVGQR